MGGLGGTRPVEGEGPCWLGRAHLECLWHTDPPCPAQLPPPQVSTSAAQEPVTVPLPGTRDSVELLTLSISQGGDASGRPVES